MSQTPNTIARHYGIYQREEVVVMGYNKHTNQLMVLRINALPQEDQMALRGIARSKFAQESADFLIPVLRREHHRRGQDWFTYLIRTFLPTGFVRYLSIKDMDNMNPDQAAFCKGYGKSLAQLALEKEKGSVTDSVAVSGAASTPTPAAAVSTTDPNVMAILQVLAQGQAHLNQTMANIRESLGATKRKRGRPSGTTKKTAKAAPVAAPAQEVHEHALVA